MHFADYDPIPEPPQPPPSLAVIIRQWIIAGICLLFLAWFIHRLLDRVPEPAPGILVPERPLQVLIKNGKPFAYKSYLITPIANFTIRARVLSVAYYSSGRDGELAPADFAVGWGSLSDSAVLDQLSISQDGRWYYISYDGQPPIRNDLIVLQSHNLHLIPANDAIAETIMRVRKNNVIKMQGYLVAVSGDHDFSWVSSLTLDRQGPHTCKLILVEKLVIEY